MARSSLVILSLAVLCGLLAGPAQADLLQLKDGRFVDGVKMARDADSIVLEYKNGSVKIPLAQVEHYIIDGVEPFEPRTEEEKAKRAEGLVPYQGRWVKPEQREKKLAAEIKKKRDLIEENRKHRKWRNRRQFKTKNFEFESTLPQAINDNYSALLQTYFKEFAKHWKTRVPKDWGRLRVCFYTSLDDFHRTGGVGRGVMAYYRFVAPRELNFFYDRRDPASTVATMFHEANHYLTDLMDERFQYPHWINEAMAEYYGASTWDADKQKMVLGGIQHGRLVEVRSDIAAGKEMTLHELITSETSDYRHYYWGWSFVHFMLETPAYSKKFEKFFNDLARAKGVKRRPYGSSFVSVSGAECLEVFKKRLRVKDLDALESAWYQHIAQLKSDALKGQELAGLAARRQGRTLRATRLLKAAIEGGSQDVSVHIAYAQILNGKPDQQGEALKILERACVLDPLEGDTWAHRGFMLTALGRKAEGEKMMALAREIDPSNDFLHLEIAAKLAEVLGEGPK